MNNLEHEYVSSRQEGLERRAVDGLVCVVTVFEFPNRLAQTRFFLLLVRLRVISRGHRCRPLLMTRGRLPGRRTVLLSLWDSDDALIGFSADLPHVQAVRWCIQEGIKVWSGVFDCRGTSSLSREWFGTRRQWLPKPKK